MTKKSLVWVMQILIPILFITWLAHFFSRTIKLHDVYEQLLGLSLRKFLILLLVSAGIWLIRSWRFYLLLRANGVKVSLKQAIKVFVSGQALAPFPGGEAARGILLQRETKVKFTESAGPLITLGFIELITAAFITIIGSVVYVQLRLAAAISLLVLVALTVFILHPAPVKALGKKLPDWKPVRHLDSHLLTIQNSMRKSLKQRILLPISLNAVLTNLLGGYLVFLIARHYGVMLNLWQSTFVYCSSIVLTAAAGIIPGGLGVTESGLTGILLLSGAALTTALVIVLLFRFVTLAFSVLVGLICLALFYAKDFLTQRKRYGAA